MVQLKIKRTNEKIKFLYNGEVSVYDINGEYLGGTFGIYSPEGFVEANQEEKLLYSQFRQTERFKELSACLRKEADLLSVLERGLPDPGNFQIVLPYDGIISGIKKKKVEDFWVLFSDNPGFTGYTGNPGVYEVLWLGDSEPHIHVTRNGNVHSHSEGTITI